MIKLLKKSQSNEVDLFYIWSNLSFLDKLYPSVNGVVLNCGNAPIFLSAESLRDSK